MMIHLRLAGQGALLGCIGNMAVVTAAYVCNPREPRQVETYLFFGLMGALVGALTGAALPYALARATKIDRQILMILFYGIIRGPGAYQRLVDDGQEREPLRPGDRAQVGFLNGFVVGSVCWILYFAALILYYHIPVNEMMLMIMTLFVFLNAAVQAAVGWILGYYYPA